MASNRHDGGVWLDRVLGAAAAVLLFCLMAVTTVDVIGRYIFNFPLRGGFEITELLLLTLIFAGLYQFSPLKYHCLDKCRSPLSFITQYWTGRHEAVAAFRLGVHHGLFCLGCCWSLMLVMFAVGTGSLAWMLALGAVMAIEKNLPWGRRLSRPVGLTLILGGIGLGLGALVAGG